MHTFRVGGSVLSSIDSQGKTTEESRGLFRKLGLACFETKNGTVSNATKRAFGKLVMRREREGKKEREGERKRKEIVSRGCSFNS